MKLDLVALANTLRRHPFLSPIEVLQIVARAHWHEKRYTCARRGFPLVHLGTLMGLDIKVCRHTYNSAMHQVDIAYRAGTGAGRLSQRTGSKRKYCLEDSTIVEY